MRVIDFDQVSLSSLNRHAVATWGDVGYPKVCVCVVYNLCVLRCSYSSAIVAYVDCFMREAHVVKGWFWESSSQQLLPCGGDAHMHTSTSNYKYDAPLHEAVVGANAQAHACAQKRAQMYWTPLNTKC